jgi:hypothetical protein
MTNLLKFEIISIEDNRLISGSVIVKNLDELTGLLELACPDVDRLVMIKRKL